MYNRGARVEQEGAISGFFVSQNRGAGNRQQAYVRHKRVLIWGDVGGTR